MEVFRYARNIQPGDRLTDGRVVRSVRVMIQFDDHPWYSVPSDDVVLVQTDRQPASLDRVMTCLTAAEDAASGLRLPAGSDAAEALTRLKRLQRLIEGGAANGTLPV